MITSQPSTPDEWTIYTKMFSLMTHIRSEMKHNIKLDMVRYLASDIALDGISSKRIESAFNDFVQFLSMYDVCTDKYDHIHLDGHSAFLV